MLEFIYSNAGNMRTKLIKPVEREEEIVKPVFQDICNTEHIFLLQEENLNFYKCL